MYCFGCLMCGCWWRWPPIYCYFDFSQIFYIHNLSFSRSLALPECVFTVPFICSYRFLQNFKIQLSTFLYCVFTSILTFSALAFKYPSTIVVVFFFEIINVVGFFPSLSRPNISKSLYLLYAIWLPVRFLYRFISILVLLSFLSHCLVHC